MSGGSNAVGGSGRDKASVEESVRSRMPREYEWEPQITTAAGGRAGTASEFHPALVYLCAPFVQCVRVEAGMYFAFEKLMTLMARHSARHPLPRQVATFLTLFRTTLPELHSYFEEEEVDIIGFATNWLQHLLAGELRIEDLMRLWDTYFALPDFMDLHLYVCIAILTNCKDSLEELDRSETRSMLDSLPPLLFTALRFVIAALPALWMPRPAGSWRWLLIAGGGIGVVQFGCLFTAMDGHISPGLASLVLQMQAFFTVLLARIVDGTKPRPWQWWGLALAFAGIALIGTDLDASVSAGGLALILVAALGWASGNLAMRRAGAVNMDVPITLGIVLALGMSVVETANHSDHAYFDGAVMLIFFLLCGRVLDAMMRERARAGIASLLRRQAQGALVLRDDGKTGWVAARDLRPGDLMLVAAGEGLAADGTIAKGATQCDLSLINGESKPQAMGVGDFVPAGAINLGTAVHVKVKAVGDDTIIAEIARLMEEAGQSRSRYVRIADRASRLYAPAVHSLALAAFAGWMLAGAGWHESLLIAIDGHTDSTGKREKNLALSSDRANAVKAYLATKGITENRMTATGYGPDKPVASNKKASGRALNRRVEMTVRNY